MMNIARGCWIFIICVYLCNFIIEIIDCKLDEVKGQ